MSTKRPPERELYTLHSTLHVTVFCSVEFITNPRNRCVPKLSLGISAYMGFLWLTPEHVILRRGRCEIGSDSPTLGSFFPNWKSFVLCLTVRLPWQLHCCPRMHCISYCSHLSSSAHTHTVAHAHTHLPGMAFLSPAALCVRISST